MKTFSEYINEKLNIEDYEASIEKSKFGGFVPIIKNKDGKTSYSGAGYKTKEIALKVAEGYLKIMVTSKSTSKLDDFVYLFRDDLVK